MCDLPVAERLLHRPKQVAATYVLILTPTRELAVQIHSMIQKLAQYTDVQAALIVGGLSVQVGPSGQAVRFSFVANSRQCLVLKSQSSPLTEPLVPLVVDVSSLH